MYKKITDLSALWISIVWMPIRIRIQISILMPIEIRIRIGIKKMLIHMQFLPEFLHMQWNGIFFNTFIRSNGRLQCFSFATVAWHRCHNFKYFGQHIEIFSKKVKKKFAWNWNWSKSTKPRFHLYNSIVHLGLNHLQGTFKTHTSWIVSSVFIYYSIFQFRNFLAR